MMDGDGDGGGPGNPGNLHRVSHTSVAAGRIYAGFA